MAERKVSDAGNGMLNVAIEVKDREKSVAHTYSIPGVLDSKGEAAPGDAFLTWLQGTTTVGTGDNAKVVRNLDIAYDRFCYATDLKERAGVREAVAVESTIIRVNGADVDLMALGTPKAVAAINAGRGLKALTGKDPGKAFEVAARKLVESGAAKENPENGMLAVVKK